MDRSDLITRLEQAEGGSFELDHQVAEAVYPHLLGHRMADGAGWTGPGWFSRPPPPYTVSLDAITALIGEKLPGSESQLLYAAMRELGNKHALHCRLWKAEVDGRFGERLSLALCIALLQAIKEGADG